MSKEIEFRAWDKKTNNMYFVASIDMFGKVVTLQDDIGDTIDFIVRAMHNVELMQFTGLLDKNGVEIYEGDILAVAHQKYLSVGDERFYRNGYKNRVVKWRVTSHHNGWNIYNAPQTQFEVIGNIYENSNLLERTKYESN